MSMTKRLWLTVAVCGAIACCFLLVSARHASAAHTRPAARTGEIPELRASVLAFKGSSAHGRVCAVAAPGCAVGCAIPVAAHALAAPRGDPLCRSVPSERPCAIPISDAPSVGSAHTGVGLCREKFPHRIELSPGRRLRPRKR
jgi:hypothetical protein